MFTTAFVAFVAVESTVAPPINLRVPLKLEVARDLKTGVNSMAVFGFQKGINLVKGYVIPDQVKPTHCGMIDFRDKPIGVIAIQAPNQLRFERIWLDMNRNKRFEESEVATFSDDKKSPYGDDHYYFKGTPRSLRGDLRAYVVGTGLYTIGLLPLAKMTAQVNLDGLIYDLDVYDTNFDGSFRSDAGRTKDALCVVQDGKRQSVNYFNQLFAVGSGRFFKAMVSRDEKTLMLIEDPTPLGAIRVETGTVQTLRIRGHQGIVSLSSVSNDRHLPAGKYVLMLANLDLVASNGSICSIDFRGDEKATIRVEPGKTTPLPFGKLPELKLMMALKGATRTFTLGLFDVNGFSITSVQVLKNGGYYRPSAPSLVIYGPDGAQVNQLALEFG